MGNLKNVVVLDLSVNQFPVRFPLLLSAWTSLEYHIVYGNSFKGTILVSLSSLKSIEEVDLSSNNLSGQLPRLFVNFSILVLLNLSYNHFDGEVPTKGIFNNKTRISLAGNGKLCGGFDGLHLPSCHSKRSRKVTRLILVIPVIISCLVILEEGVLHMNLLIGYLWNSSFQQFLMPS